MAVGMAHGDRIPSGEALAMLDDFIACTVFDEFLASVRGDGPIVADGLERITCPIRIAWAQHDRTIPFKRYGQPLIDLLPGAEHVTLAGVGHMPMYDAPELVARTILDVTLTPPAAA
jgi:pimeloyl-ACP methyl ester carboxylesterase